MNSSKIVKAWLIAGTLDILAAITQFYIKTGKNPDIVLKYIASAVFGKPAYTGGVLMSGCGLLFHYIVVFAFTIFFFLIFPKVYSLFKSRILIAILYGIFMQGVMQFIVVPLTLVRQSPFNLSNTLIATAILIVCIGIPLSFMADKNSRS